MNRMININTSGNSFLRPSGNKNAAFGVINLILNLEHGLYVYPLRRRQLLRKIPYAAQTQQR